MAISVGGVYCRRRFHLCPACLLFPRIWILGARFPSFSTCAFGILCTNAMDKVQGPADSVPDLFRGCDAPSTASIGILGMARRRKLQPIAPSADLTCVESTPLPRSSRSFFLYRESRWHQDILAHIAVTFEVNLLHHVSSVSTLNTRCNWMIELVSRSLSILHFSFTFAHLWQ
jgi:hypothetical protein